MKIVQILIKSTAWK